MFLFKFCFGPIRTNSYLFGCEKKKEAVVIDAAYGATNAIIQKAEELGIEIKKVLLTHSHWDHIADAKILKEKTRAPLCVHPLDAENLRSPGADYLPFPIPIESVEPDELFEDGDLIQVGDLALQVIHSPGHSPGSVCFYQEKEHLLFAGDTLFKGGWGNCSFPTSDEEKMWNSLSRLAKLPSVTRVVSGHGPDTTIGSEEYLCRL